MIQTWTRALLLLLSWAAVNISTSLSSQSSNCDCVCTSFSAEYLCDKLYFTLDSTDSALSSASATPTCGCWVLVPTLQSPARGSLWHKGPQLRYKMHCSWLRHTEVTQVQNIHLLYCISNSTLTGVSCVSGVSVKLWKPPAADSDSSGSDSGLISL